MEMIGSEVSISVEKCSWMNVVNCCMVVIVLLILLEH